MWDKIKLSMVVWGSIFLLICFFVTLGVWMLCSLWWLITNQMIDRNIFLLICLGVSKLVSVLFFSISMVFPEKNKNNLSI